MTDESGLPLSTRGISIDLHENPNEYIVHADLPGVDKNDIKVTVNNRVLEITAQRQREKKEENLVNRNIDALYFFE